jgi:hypothetical protein
MSWCLHSQLVHDPVPLPDFPTLGFLLKDQATLESWLSFLTYPNTQLLLYHSIPPYSQWQRTLGCFSSPVDAGGTQYFL